MFSTIFGPRAGGPARIETRREAVERLLADLNAAIDMMPEKPAVTVHPSTGHIRLELPEERVSAARKVV